MSAPESSNTVTAPAVLNVTVPKFAVPVVATVIAPVAVTSQWPVTVNVSLA